MAMVNILVTGSSRGIGRAIASHLAARGAHVITHASRPGATLGAAQVENGAIIADFNDPPGPSQLWAEALDRAGGRIDVLVNTSALLRANALDGSDIAWLDGWDEALRINLTAAAQLSRLAVRHWQAARANGAGPENLSAGRILHIARNTRDRAGAPLHWHHEAARAGLLAMHESIARLHAGEGILSFAITPGPDGDSGEAERGDARGDDFPASAPANASPGAMATPEDIAAIAAFCALDAPASMTGAVIAANGARYGR